MDPKLGDNIDVRNWISILVTTHDGALLGPSSFKRAGCGPVMHQSGPGAPWGVLQLFDTEAVLAFWQHTDMMATMHCLTAAKVWWGELAMPHIIPLKGGQVSKYIAKRGSCPSGAQMHIQGGGVGIEPSPQHGQSRLRAVRGPGIHTTGRTDQGCLGPWQWSTTGSARGSANWNSPEGGGCTHTGVTPWKSIGPWCGSEAVTDDREVDPRRERGWSYGEAVPRPVSPHQLTLDVGQLLSMLMAGMMMGTPHINTFIGDATPGKTIVSFKLWYHEVWCLKDHYPEAVVWESIIWSLSTSHGGVQNYQQGNGNNHEGGTSQGDCDMEAGPFLCSHVRVPPAAPQMCKGWWEPQEGDTPSNKLWPHCP